MTTIVARGNCMASDSQQTAGDLLEPIKAQKIYRVNGSLVGLSGNPAQGWQFLEWLRDETDELAYPEMDGAQALVLTKDGIYSYDNEPVPINRGEYCATGSGRDVAIGALLHGATPEEAVRTAAEVDVYSGGDIQVYYLEEYNGSTTSTDA